MNRITILIYSFLIAFTAHAQVNTDSLRAIINTGRTYEEQVNAAISLVKNFELKNFDSAIIEGNKALQLARKHTDSISVAELKRTIGVANYFRGNYDVAAKNYYESIAILESRNDKKRLAPVYNELAKLYRKTRDLDKAIENYNKASAIYTELRDTSGISTILNESGVVYEYRENYKEAINRYTASMKLAEAAGDSLSVSYSLSNIAGVYVIEKKYELAEANLLRALYIRQELKDSFAMALTFSDLGVAMNAKGDYQKAIKYLTLSNRVAEKLKYPELQSNNYTELATVAQKQGDFQKAFEFFTKRTALRDSLYDIEKTKQTKEMEARYENAKKEHQIQEQKSRLRLQTFLFIGIGGLILLSLLFANSQYKRYRLKKETQLQTEIMKHQELAAKAVLKAEENERERIAKDLHDGVGQMMSAAKMNLSAFESEIQLTDTEQKKSLEKIIQLVDESCKEVRTVSHIMMPNALLKNNLAVAINDFVNKLSQKNLRVQVSTEGMEERFDITVETVLYRIIQECVHNTMKHSGATTLDISLIRDKDGISGTIEDNGRGFTISETSDGIGLKNISTRIGYLKGTVDIDSSPGRGTLIALHIPL